MVGITIRKPVRDDVEKLAELAGQLGYPSTATEMTRRLARIRDDARHVVLVAADGDNNPVGWIHGRVVDQVESNPFVEIAGMVVAEEHRSIGIGARLLNKVEDWARSTGVARIRVRSNVKRKRAHAFYVQAGYEQTKKSMVFEKAVQ